MESTLWQTVLALLTALGGGGLIVLGLSSWLGKLWADRLGEQLKASNTQALERIKADFLREVESYKIKLKKSEFLFQKEFEAASEFSRLIQSIHPGFNHPMMDWYEACDVIAQSFGSIEFKLNGFLAKFGAVLTEDERKILTNAISDAGYGKFEAVGEDVSAEANKQAGKLYTDLQELEKKMIGRVRDQSSL